MSTGPQLADQLDPVTAQQRGAQDATATAREALSTIRHHLADASAAGTPPTEQQLEHLAAARDRLELAELHELGLARERRRLLDEAGDRPPSPLVDDPRGIVRVRVVGKPGRHACNQPSTGRALLGGQLVDVTADDAVALAVAGYAELVGALPAWWPHEVPATGQLAAALA